MFGVFSCFLNLEAREPKSSLLSMLIQNNVIDMSLTDFRVYFIDLGQVLEFGGFVVWFCNYCKISFNPQSYSYSISGSGLAFNQEANLGLASLAIFVITSFSFLPKSTPYQS